ncbi:hypothetical protein [Deinococcus irradiatisoli]|uniref:hypothetical protein n=1 Tax=Deinococcus irradiatisoli TaxID=2202254 RepID=UPI0011B1CFE6|nr:hypothetical protein [Deinococcus irradiatisoli]
MNRFDWPAPPERLRTEVQAMLDALIEALGEVAPPHTWRGLYFKGSASKLWHSPCDYLPELSDLDLHLWLHGGEAAALPTSTRSALAFAERVERGYQNRIAAPLHWPRPQVLLLNGRLTQSGWARSGVTVLSGEAYPGAAPDPASDRSALWQVHREAQHLGPALFDKPGPYGWAALRAVNWRISPAPARLLSALGAGEWVWQAPRSALFEALSDRGLSEVAGAFEAYYRWGWLAFSRRWQDGAAMREAVHAGLGALALAAESSGPAPA